MSDFSRRLVLAHLLNIGDKRPAIQKAIKSIPVLIHTFTQVLHWVTIEKNEKISLLSANLVLISDDCYDRIKV
jgi:hypothetical protein